LVARLDKLHSDVAIAAGERGEASALNAIATLTEDASS
jgi:hypothetical protein